MAGKKTKEKMPPALLENAYIQFRNFSGKAGMYNEEGDRNFAIFLDPDLADAMARAGWNVKTLKPRDDGERPQDYLEVSVSFKGPFPPKIYLVTSRGKTLLDQEDVNILDWAEIANVDLTLNPYAWEVNGKTGVKAYLKSIFVTIVEDDLDRKYADVPDSAKSAVSRQDDPEEDELDRKYASGPSFQ